LNHLFAAGLIHVADKLHGYLAAITLFQRQVVITDIRVLLQPLQHGLIGHEVLEWTKFADGFADHFTAGKTQ